MLLYTVMPLETVLEDLDKEYDFKEISIGQMRLVVEPLDYKQFKIIRIISSNPKDYLSIDIYPGKIINIHNFEA